ncbi:hypothetical protein CASFOL_036161 [Castilleja foliolosa]|uniref:Uncharacterized protein n=1 Tax=Castilleja foliolosa TaxID=1961234 RepID=A0ABD3BVX7_9LAMI
MTILPSLDKNENWDLKPPNPIFTHTIVQTLIQIFALSQLEDILTSAARIGGSATAHSNDDIKVGLVAERVAWRVVYALLCGGGDSRGGGGDLIYRPRLDGSQKVTIESYPNAIPDFVYHL